MSGNVPFSTVGMIGAGSMGSMMSFLMWENGYEVYFLDPNSDSVKRLNQNAANVGAQDKVVEKTDYKSLCSAVKQNPDGLGVFILSIPHGQAADAAVESLRPHLSRGDIIVDCGNEHYANTERRQKELDPAGIHYIGCGVSGGYQSARSGPSFSPGGDPDTLNKLMPFFTQLAAKDGDGQPCTGAVGPGSSGHYVKTVHNGIEQGMMSAVAEAWLLLIRGLGLSYDEASDVFRSWNEHGPLRSCFLIAIGRDILKTKDDRGEQVLAHVRDKVVQDVDDSEGTGVWTCEEAISQHVPAATIVASHLFRDASADAALRMTNRQSTGSEIEPRQLNVSSKESFIQAIEKAIYFSFLTCYIQGFGIIQKKNKSKGWNLNCTDIIQIWRTGTIIEASHVLDVLNEAFKRNECDPEDLLADGGIGAELSYNYPTIKEVVLKAVEADMFVPGLSQSLEYYKYSTSTELPTQFMEAQLDYFGEHMFDRKEDPPGKPQKGSRHFEWKRAKGSVDK